MYIYILFMYIYFIKGKILNFSNFKNKMQYFDYLKYVIVYKIIVN